MTSIYTRAAALTGPEFEVPLWSILYLTELRLCIHLSNLDGSTHVVELPAQQIAPVVKPHRPLQSLLVLAELGVIDDLAFDGTTASFAPNWASIRSIADDAEAAGIVIEVAQ